MLRVILLTSSSPIVHVAPAVECAWPVCASEASASACSESSAATEYAAPVRLHPVAPPLVQRAASNSAPPSESAGGKLNTSPSWQRDDDNAQRCRSGHSVTPKEIQRDGASEADSSNSKWAAVWGSGRWARRGQFGIAALNMSLGGLHSSAASSRTSASCSCRSLPSSSNSWGQGTHRARHRPAAAHNDNPSSSAPASCKLYDLHNRLVPYKQVGATIAVGCFLTASVGLQPMVHSRLVIAAHWAVLSSSHRNHWWPRCSPDAITSLGSMPINTGMGLATPAG